MNFETNPVSGSTGSAVIEGVVQFRGGTYCKSVAITSGTGVTVTVTQYVSQDGTDIWNQTDVNGRVTEAHSVNGQIVSTGTTPVPQ